MRKLHMYSVSNMVQSAIGMHTRHFDTLVAAYSQEEAARYVLENGNSSTITTVKGCEDLGPIKVGIIHDYVEF